MGAARIFVVTAALLGALVGAPAVAQAAPAKPNVPAEPRIKVLSNRADLISGGDALVAIRVPKQVLVPEIRVSLRGRVHGKARSRNITGQFKRRANRRFKGLVRGLKSGRNVVTARLRGGGSDRAVINNHPNGGPVFSGPQLKPWVCQESARDRKCNQKPQYSFFYKSTSALEPGLQPYDRANPPSDVAMTTTDRGVTVPFIVRVETGYQDRDQYKIATLYQPGKRWRPWASQPQWNHKLLMTHGAGCGASYAAGQAPAVFGALTVGIPGLDDVIGSVSDDVGRTALGRGFAVGSTALNNNSHNCNIAVQAESMVMLKEHLIESYGHIRYTIAAGCSGGAVTQQQVANAYPGIYQGLTPQCSYPDTLSPGTQFADYHMLRLYFEDPSRWGPGVVWLPTQWAEVEGHLAHLNAIVADEGLFKSAITPTYPCPGVSDAQRFDPETNPDGVRCDVLSYMINVLGPRPRRVWSPLEHQIGHGLAAIPFGNVGVQYGLSALRKGAISKDQFVDLNAEIGGLSLTDLSATPRRLRGDIGGLRNAYRSGAFNSANNLDRVAIINLGGPDPGAAHDYSHSFFMRSRLEREQHGHLGNYVMWFGDAPIIGDVQYRTQAFLAMDRWLAAVEKDHRSIPLSRKIVKDRPADIVDRCDVLPGTTGEDGLCDEPLVQTRLGTPRTVSGSGIASDVGACRLTPLRRTDYYPINFTAGQWDSLKGAFPRGVCDWSRPGRGQRDTIAWLSYQRGGKVVYGGRRLGRAPVRSGGGWTSRSFGSWRRPR